MRRIKTVSAVLAVLLCVCVVMSSAKTVHAAADETQTGSLSLHSENPDENLPFQMTNMFPGDSETRYYRVSVSYTGTVTLSFRAEPSAGDEKLGEVLKMKVRLVNTDEILYEGSLTSMPGLETVLTTDSEAQTDELCYEITASLGTEVGNEYQSKVLIADLSWWAQGSEGESSSTEGGSGSGGSLVAPDSGDHSQMLLWLGCAVAALAVMLLALAVNRRKLLTGAGAMEARQAELHRTGETAVQKSRKKLWIGIILMVCLLLAFGITSLALMYEKISVEGNLFETGRVSICLNDNKPVFDEEILFEPGMRIVKDFTLRNDSSCDVYYRLWFSGIEGDFADVLEVRVADGENVIFEGKFSELNGVKSEGANGKLAKGEERLLSILFHVPENCDNVMQANTVLFDLNAEAVQAVNNPDSVFE